MPLKDGFQVCPRCQGEGCYRCHRKGFLAQCPVCMNSEPELITRGEDGYNCRACGTTFTKGGDILAVHEPKKRPPKPT